MRARAALIGSLALVWSLSGTAPLAQNIPQRSMEDQVLGWIRVYDYKPATAPITVDTRVYSPAQLSIARNFANWMQASYLPKGALGDVLQIRNAKLSPYNQNTAAQPNAYGALAKFYTELKYDANKKIVPLTSDAFLWGMKPTGFTGIPPRASARQSTTTSRCRRSRNRDSGRTLIRRPTSHATRCWDSFPRASCGTPSAGTRESSC